MSCRCSQPNLSQCPPPFRIATITPIVLLCLLGVTFYIGGRPGHAPDTAGDSLRGMSATTKGVTCTSTATSVRPSTPNDNILTQAWNTLRRRNRSRNAVGDTHAGNSTPSSFRIALGIPKRPSRRRSSFFTGRTRHDVGVSPAITPAPPAVVASEGRAYEGGVSAAETLSPAMNGAVVRTVEKHQRSARSVWRAGPCDVAGSEQVCFLQSNRG